MRIWNTPTVISALFLFMLQGLLSGCAARNSENLKDLRPILFEHQGTQLTADIILPESYTGDNNVNYPVIYLLDGYWNKQSIGGFYKNLRYDNIIPEAIIVSIEYPETIENLNNQRMKDLTPKFDQGFGTGGDADAFLQVITQQLIPYIDSNYRVDKSRTILTGHSLAGLFTLYAMYKNPGQFTHYAAISPSALWADEYLLEVDTKYSTNNHSLEAQVYMTYGTDEYAPYVQALKRYIEQIQAENYDNLDLTLASVEGMRHTGMTSEGFIRAIVWAFSDLQPEGPSTFERINIEANRNCG